MPLKELLAQLDATQFVQVHRSVVVNLRAVSHVTRGQNETAQVHLRGRDEVLPVSRSFLHHSGRCERGSPCQQGAPGDDQPRLDQGVQRDPLEGLEWIGDQAPVTR
jgi:hypothetical protein